MNCDLLNQALSLLEDVTPLNTDCGLLCGASCCRDNGDAGSGVWLLPGEDTASFTWGQVRSSVMPVTKTKACMLICEKDCFRPLRPFMCRIFPLSPYWSVKKGAWSVRMDRRAAAVCPLFACGKKGLSSDFVNRAENAVRLISQDKTGEEWLRILESEESAYRFKL